jgi:uncharacterized protein YbjT (DUF2867 family)
MLRVLLLPSLVALVSSSEIPTVVVTGATGETGYPLYRRLKEAGGFNVRAFVRNASKAKAILGCDKCDESEGVFLGDMTDQKALDNAMKGAQMLAITTAAVFDCNGPLDPKKPPCYFHDGAFPIDVDWKGTVKAVTALAENGGDKSSKMVIYLSSRDTWNPDSTYGNLGNGHQSFYKLNAEAFVEASGIPYAIVKPCGLGSDKGEQYKLVVGHDSQGYPKEDTVIDREDVARVIVAALQTPAAAKGLRFDLCSDDNGAVTKDIVKDVFDKARYPWDAKRPIVV